MSKQTAYDIQVTNDIHLGYDFVLSAYYLDEAITTIRVCILAEMSQAFERILNAQNAVISFAEVK